MALPPSPHPLLKEKPDSFLPPVQSLWCWLCSAYFRERHCVESTDGPKHDAPSASYLHLRLSLPPLCHPQPQSSTGAPSSSTGTAQTTWSIPQAAMGMCTPLISAPTCCPRCIHHHTEYLAMSLLSKTTLVAK